MSSLTYKNGTPVKIGDVVQICDAICTVRRFIQKPFYTEPFFPSLGVDAKITKRHSPEVAPAIVVCSIEGCGDIDHGISPIYFSSRNPITHQP